MAQPSEDVDAQAQPRKSRVRSNPRRPAKQALLTGPGGEDVTRGGLVFDEVTDERDLRAIEARSTIGHRDLNKFVGDVFSQWFELEGEDDRLVQAIEELNTRLRLQAKLWDATKHAMLDGIALLYKNFADLALDPREAVTGAKGIASLLPIYEPDVVDLFADRDRQSERFSLIESADVHLQARTERGSLTGKTLWKGRVHHSRFFHIAWEPLYGNLRGRSYFEPSHDSYKAQKNIEWAMGETFHRNAAGTKLVDAGPDATDKEIDELEKHVKDLDASKELMVPPGAKISTVKPTPIPPKDYAGYFLKTVSTMPETLLVGAHEGAVTGSETNLRIYFGDVKIVQEQFVTPMLLDFYTQLQDFNILPAGELPAIVWNPIWTLTQDQEAMVWERKARAARMLVGNDLKGDPQLMPPAEVRRLVLGLDPEPAAEDLAARMRAERMEIGPEDRRHFIGLMARVTAPVIREWEEDFVRVSNRMRRAVLRRARELLAGRLDARTLLGRAFRRRQVKPGDVEGLVEDVASAVTPSHLGDLGVAVRLGFREALIAGVGSVELKEVVSERADQEMPAELTSWWEANSTRWSAKLSADTVAGIKGAVREGLLAGDSMNELEARLGDQFDLKQHELERIARTETIRAANEGRIREYKRLGIARLVFMATPDDRTDPQCLSLDGQAFTLESASGVIPVHPNCRCTWVAERELA